MQCHADNACATECASKALASLASVSKGNVEWLGPLGACEALLSAHDTHSDDVAVVSAVWNAIGTLCSYNRERLGSLGTPSRVVQSLRSFYPDVKTVEKNTTSTSTSTSSACVASAAAYAIGRLCEPLQNLSVPLENRMALFDAGCCEVLTAVLKIEYNDLSAATTIFKAIATLTNGSGNFKVHVF